MDIQTLATEAYAYFEWRERRTATLSAQDAHDAADFLDILNDLHEGEYLDREDVKRLSGVLRDVRDPEPDQFLTLVDGRPEWVHDLCYAAHSDFPPDDYRYALIRSALSTLSEDEGADDHEFADSEVDTYTAARFQWLASNLKRMEYVDQAQDEFGHADNIADAVGRGQFVEAAEVFNLVRAALQAWLDEVEDDSNNEEETT